MRIIHSNDNTPFTRVIRAGEFVPQEPGLNLSDVRVGDVLIVGVSMRAHTVTEEDIKNQMVLFHDGKVWRGREDGHPVFISGRTKHTHGTAEWHSQSEMEGGFWPHDPCETFWLDVRNVKCLREERIQERRWHWNASGCPGTLEDFALKG
jgi:hypothetical protein